ncbi:hypothetical protein KACHI17_18920 [Sediminibacterium sp. KACHI17]|jgi:hypothetical protein|uniref:Uncharacterized protein n=1 Tax=Sediminibacterium sp. KACHI17 TaxID=1751071 RepID=A0AAT9GK09_9BACT
MVSSSDTIMQSIPGCSKKVSDMILYAVAREMATRLLSDQPEENPKHTNTIVKRKKVIGNRHKKMLAV